MLQTARSLRTELQRGTRQIQDRIAEKAKEGWQVKMRGQMPSNLNEKLVVNERSYRWLKFGDIQGETESTIVAAPDETIVTNYFKNKILKEEIDSKCRLCKQREETIDHITSGYRILAKNGPLMRSDEVCAHLRYSVCKALVIETTEYGTHADTHTHTHTQISMRT